MMGEQSVAQVFLGIVICAMWLCLLIQKKPYRSNMDNWVAIILAGHLLLTGLGLKTRHFPLNMCLEKNAGTSNRDVGTTKGVFRYLKGSGSC